MTRKTTTDSGQTTFIDDTRASRNRTTPEQEFAWRLWNAQFIHARKKKQAAVGVDVEVEPVDAIIARWRRGDVPPRA
jgi:hypothetical protein